MIEPKETRNWFFDFSLDCRCKCLVSDSTLASGRRKGDPSFFGARTDKTNVDVHHRRLSRSVKHTPTTFGNFFGIIPPSRWNALLFLVSTTARHPLSYSIVQNQMNMRYSLSSTSALLAAVSWTCFSASFAFVPSTVASTVTTSFISVRPCTPHTVSSSTSLCAVGALVKKAKEQELRKYIESGVEEHVMEKYNLLKENLATINDETLADQVVGPLQESLTRRKGTITVIAEYKRKCGFNPTGLIHEMHVPELLSPSFREYGASAIAVMADPRMGGCDYDDIRHFVEEQRRAKMEVPGPLPVINNDLIVDELQVARSAAYGCAALVLNLPTLGVEQTKVLLKATKAVDLEAIVAVSSKEEAQTAIDSGARMLSILHLGTVEDMVAAVDGLVIPEGQQVCKIANILANNDQQLQEIEDAWSVRDQGFNSVWVGEALYKGGADPNEQPGGIIKSMKSKSSLKFASPKAARGRGEGAREYLGDILM